jgi:D-alanyl-D-alanine carboxypeptidase (penicillin-binding protein 5/6)
MTARLGPPKQNQAARMLTRRQLIASGAGALLAGAAVQGVAQEASELDINSARYICTNADTGAVFAQRGAHDQVAIASLTKVFTAMEAVSVAPLDTRITTTEDDLQSADATTMGFGPGETFTLEELIYGMLLPSGNDAAYAVARALGAQEGDSAEEAVQRFMDRMNERVVLMGLTNTHLLNPDGWGVDGHYSSAADVAAFMAYASTNAFVLEAMGTPRYTTSAGYNLVNSNKVLTSAPSVLGGKTGYDWDSGWCLVQIAERQTTRIIAVTLDGIAPDDWYDDNLVLLDYGFNQQRALGSKEFDGEFVRWSDPAPALFAQSGEAEAQISGESRGEVVVSSGDTTIADVPERVDADTSRLVSEPSGDSGIGRGAIFGGIGATALVAGMAISRWKDFGGDRTAATIAPSVQAAASSLRHNVPPFSLVPAQSRSQRDVVDVVPMDVRTDPE